jgi:protein ImuA
LVEKRDVIMPGVRREQQLSQLRERIAGIEKRPPLASAPAVPQGERPGRYGALLNPPGGLLHEIYADQQRDGGAAFGFALGLARGLLSPARPAVLFLQLAHEGKEMGLPYGPGLKSFGFSPEQLIVARLANPVDLLWAVEEATACRAVAAVVAEMLGEPKALDFTASRRLSLRAASGGASVLLLRYGQGRAASAARLRWRISPASSQAPPFDTAAPGQPRWQVELEKGRLGPGLMQAGIGFLLDWTGDGFEPVGTAGTSGDGGLSRPAPSGAPPAVLGDRLSQAG